MSVAASAKIIFFISEIMPIFDSVKIGNFMKTRADYPKLNLPPCRLKVAGRGGELCVWDAGRGGGIAGRGVSGRGRWLVLTPEEWVRRHVLAMLASRAGVEAASIAQEYPVEVGGTTQRADIVVFGPGGRPLMLIECKAPGVAIDSEVLAQAFRYNTVLGARHVMLTNGLDHYIYEVSPDGEYLPLKSFPELA